MTPPADTAPGRVLVVDDDPLVRRLVVAVLAAAGYAADAAGGVDEALSFLPLGGYDAAFVDLDMPGRSGLEFLDALPATGSDLVPVLLTGTRDVASAVAGMKRGAFDFLAKPADPEAMRWTARRAVAAARARRRERALEGVVNDWAATFDACPDRLLVLDAGGRVLRANRAAGAVPVGAAVAAALPPALAAAVRGGVPGTVADAGRHYLVSADPVAGTGSAVVVIRDVTDLVRAEADRSRLAHQLLTAQEDERGRLARDLHDGLGQAVVALAVGLGTLADAAAPGPDRDRLRKLAAEATETLVEIRRMAHGLRPAVLDDLGLVAALGRLAEQFTAAHRVRAALVLPDPPPGRLPRGVEAAVYRIVQEALTNVARHAAATTVDITLEVADGAVRAAVSDDGTGRPAGPNPGIGLAGMRERAAVFGGTVRIESAPGRGTTVDARIPIPPEDSP